MLKRVFTYVLHDAKFEVTRKADFELYASQPKFLQGLGAFNGTNAVSDTVQPEVPDTIQDVVRAAKLACMCRKFQTSIPRDIECLAEVCCFELAFISR